MLIPFSQILLSCAIAMTSLLIYCIAGYVLARKGVLKDREIRGLSQITQDVLIPAMTFTDFITMDREQVMSYYPVMLSAVISIFLGMFIGMIVCKYIVRQNAYSTMFQIITGFTHTINIQLSMVEALAPLLDKIDVFENKTYSLNSQSRGIVFVVIYTNVNTLIRWSLLTKMINEQETHNHIPTPDESELPNSQVELVESHIVTHKQEKHEQLLTKQPEPVTPRAKKSCWQSIVDIFNAPLLFAFISVIITVIPPLQRLFVTEEGIVRETLTESATLLSEATSPVLMVLLGASFGYSEPGEEHVSFKVLAGGNFAKMIVMPILGLGITFGFKVFSIVTDPTMMMVILVSFAAPTANNIMIQYANLGKEMGTISKMVLSTYFVSVITVPLTLLVFFGTFPLE